jgi:polyribonucleotide nucleotidyltransferase
MPMTNIINPLGKEIIEVETDFLGKKLSFEVNKVGFRSTSSVLVKYGETVILGTAMLGGINEELDYFPLSVEYEEKFYASGKISGSRFIKREGRPSDEAILIGRLIDRPIRPLWPKGYRNEVQAIATVLSLDPSFRPDVIAMIATSCALMLTGAPFDGPIAGLRVGFKDNKPIAFLSNNELTSGLGDIVVAGTSSGVTMVEAGANQIKEERVIEAIKFGFENYQPAIQLQQELLKKVGIKPLEYVVVTPNQEIVNTVEKYLENKLGKNLQRPYPERNELLATLKQETMDYFASQDPEKFTQNKKDYEEAFTLAVHQDVRREIIENRIRPDGRKFDEIRPLSSEVSFLPRAHGSSIFTRGLTQALNVVTLAPLSFSQVIDTMEQSAEKRYMHHYNAPGYTVGEVRRLGSPGRREIGHSYLAERALNAVIPDEKTFPYAIRSVTEIMSQNGSTSMAATCSSCLALMDAGVPIKSPVSGIAMGLVTTKTENIVLSDIADAEDFAGDMDFKVAGTSEGITALQMDMKVHGLSVEVLASALDQAKKGRAFILKHMLDTLSGSRKQLSKYAPRVESIHIKPDKIREVIGKGGEVIQKIIADTGATIDINDDGTIFISGSDLNSLDLAKTAINNIVTEPEVGKIYKNAKVVSLLDFGAFVQFLPNKDGMVHVSEIGDKRVNKPSDVLKIGDRVDVKLVAIDNKGRNQLSIRAAEKELKNEN